MNDIDSRQTAAPVLSRRSSGVLLHPSSLPGQWGIGDLGPEARKFVDFLYETGQTLWEVLPIGPTGYGDSPYQGLSAFAGNPNLISPDLLLEDDLLTADDLAGAGPFNDASVDFGAVIPWKRELLQRAFEHFRADAGDELKAAYDAFRSKEAEWLEDYTLFAALKEANGGAQWTLWAPELARRDTVALHKAGLELQDQVEYHTFAQFLFFRQWFALKSYANSKSVNIIGDIPIFLAHDSADVWANQDIFYLDLRGELTAQAGAAPDSFSETGQLWGNALYRWDVLRGRGYDWWVKRFRAGLQQADILRLDHFRGFAAYWEVPAGAENAAGGRWAPGPGADLFEAASRALGPLPLIAEDLGVITPDVDALREKLGYPGMKVLQESNWADPTSTYLPHNYTQNFAIYPGTHDMATTRGWWNSMSEDRKKLVRLYSGRDGHDIVWDMIRLSLQSVANLAITQMQDLFDLDNSARMNMPGQPGGNWVWRYKPEQLSDSVKSRLALLTYEYNRSRKGMPPPPEFSSGA